MSDTIYFVIYSNTSRNSMAGLRPNVTWTFENTIKNAAYKELSRCGLSFEDLAGVEWIENEDGNFKPARELTDAEVLILSVEKLGDDGRIYEIFSTDISGTKQFVEAAEKFGLDDEARVIIEKLACISWQY